MGNKRFKRQVTALICAALMDGALLGASAGIMRTAPSHTEQEEDVQVGHIQPEHPQQGRIQTDSGAADTPGKERSTHVKVVALTFDDGPDQDCTPALLDGLKERGVHASFFLMGQSIPGNEGLVRRINQEGHLIGNHSYRHIQLTKAGKAAVCEAVEQTEELIASITGTRPQYLRPPFGDWNEELECRVGLSTVFWSLDSLDWKLQDTARIVSRIENNVADGDIILMHDIFPTSVEAALQAIDRLQALGYQFVTVDELLID